MRGGRAGRKSRRHLVDRARTGAGAVRAVAASAVGGVMNWNNLPVLKPRRLVANDVRVAVELQPRAPDPSEVEIGELFERLAMMLGLLVLW